MVPGCSKKNQVFFTLGIETSCDDTSAAVLDGTEVIANVVSSQTKLHAEFGGVVPELASRAHLRNIAPVVNEALSRAGIGREAIGLVAATYGPGLIGSLLVGLNYAKATAYALGVPFVGVNHLEAHFFSPFIENPGIEFPVMSLIVSGGHTLLYLSPEEGHYELLAATRDDAVGEAYDKVAKLLGLPYPGGPFIDRIAEEFLGVGIRFSLPKISDGSRDFSYSGLKTSVLQYVQKESIPVTQNSQQLDPRTPPLLKGFQEAAIAQLVDRIESFRRERSPRCLLVGGGVACNSALRRECHRLGEQTGLRVYFPSPIYSTDNAAMVAWVGYRRFQRSGGDPLNLNADSNSTLE